MDKDIRNKIKNKKALAFFDNAKVILVIGVLLFVALLGVSIASVAWGVVSAKIFIGDRVFLVVYMIMYESVKITFAYQIKQEEYGLECRKAKKKGMKLPQKTKLDFLSEAASYKNDINK